MYTKFAVALIAPMVAAIGDNNGVGRDNAMSYTVDLTNGSIDLNLYNARVSNDDGTFTYELHGDFGISVTQSSKRWMYGFCLRPAELGGGPNDRWWDCMTVKVDLRDEANLTTRFVQDGKVGTNDLTSGSDFLAAWLAENADWVELEAKSSLCDPLPDASAAKIDCNGFNTHFKRDFETGENDKDYQLRTIDLGDPYEMVAFVQEYADTQAIWDDSAILPDTAQNSVDAPQSVTPVMTAFINLANAADSALS